MRVAPEAVFLGERPRLTTRIGKRVTQEEIAEHLGISRGWYTRSEAGAQVAFSIPLLTRLSDMLLLSAEAQFPQPGGDAVARLAEARASVLRRLSPEQVARLDALWHAPRRVSC
jgi:transcriptional regulator with XRE-family HTH domain